MKFKELSTKTKEYWQQHSGEGSLAGYFNFVGICETDIYEWQSRLAESRDDDLERCLKLVVEVYARFSEQVSHRLFNQHLVKNRNHNWGVDIWLLKKLSPLIFGDGVKVIRFGIKDEIPFSDFRKSSIISLNSLEEKKDD